MSLDQRDAYDPGDPKSPTYTNDLLDRADAARDNN